MVVAKERRVLAMVVMMNGGGNKVVSFCKFF